MQKLNFLNFSRWSAVAALLAVVLWLPVTSSVAGAAEGGDSEAAAAGETAAESDAGAEAEAGHAAGDAHGADEEGGGAGHGEADGHGGEGHEEHPTGVPLEFRADLALWSLVTFVIFVVVLRVLAWGKLVAGLDSREAGIRRNIADAEAARLSSERMLREHEAKLAEVQEEVRAILAEARSDAEQTRQSIVSEAQAEAESSRRRAVEDIERARDQALKELFDLMSSQVLGATELVVGRTLEAGDHDRLVREALEQVGSQSGS